MGRPKKDGSPAKPKKPKDPNAPKKSKLSWKALQMKRFSKVEKTLKKLTLEIKASNPPGVSPVGIDLAATQITAASAAINALADTWKPARGSKIGTDKKMGIGSVVRVKADLDKEAAKTFAYVDKELFSGATIIADDGRDWIVECTDKSSTGVHIKRVLRKKYAELQTAPKEEKVEEKAS